MGKTNKEKHAHFVPLLRQHLSDYKVSSDIDHLTLFPSIDVVRKRKVSENKQFA